jgi:ABC-type uncharacterized transport system permease subunit
MRLPAMSKVTAAIMGFLVAPLVSAVIGAVLTPVEGRLNLDLVSILGLLPIIYFFAALATILLGVPSFLLLLKYKLVTWWSALIVGVVAGVIVALIFKAPSHVEARDLLVMGTMGSASALAFWVIWRLGR